jgi:cysteinyl-tRNA synthetase
VRSTNSYLNGQPGTPPRTLLVEAVARYLTRMLGILGCAGQESVGLGEAESSGGQPREEVLAPYLDALTTFRSTVRSMALAKASPGELLALCDRLRDDVMPGLGVRIDDRGGDGLWKLCSAEELAQEAEREAELRKAKEEAKAEAARRAQAKVAKEAAAVPLELLFRQPEYEGQFGGFDNSGFPTSAADGQPLSKSLVKKLEKLRAAAQAKLEKAAAKAAAAAAGGVDALSLAA